jgi:hypothetical protein
LSIFLYIIWTFVIVDCVYMTESCCLTLFSIFNKPNMHMLSGCELIDTENISLLSHNMKWVKRTNHHILSSRLIFFNINNIHIQMTCFIIILKSNRRIYGPSILYEKLHDSKYDWLIDWCLTSSEQFFSYIKI